MYNKTLSLILIFSLAFNIAFVGIWAYNRFGEEQPAPAPVPRQTWEQIGLDREQQRRMEQSWRGLQRELVPLQARLARERDRLLELMAEPDPDEEAIRATQRRMAAVQEEMRRCVMIHMRETRERLTPEQRRRMFHMMRTWGRRRGHAPAGRRRQGMGRPSGPGGQPEEFRQMHDHMEGARR
ncbi:MAG: periplasmic heavy metal sensor [Candidatus Brocadiia bacterium]